MTNIQAHLWEAINRLDFWIQENGWEGYDPYDLKGSSFFLWLQRPNHPLPIKIGVCVGRFIPFTSSSII